MRPCNLFPRLSVGLSLCLSLVLAACSNEPTSVSTDRPAAGPLFAVGVDNATGAIIETEKDDYVPGEIVHLSMRGWEANENVRLVMTESPETHADVDTTVTVDSVGDWSGHFYDVQEHDLGVTFTLTATGLVSGSVATVVFTDARTIDGVVLDPSSPIAGNDFDIDVTVTLSGGDDWETTRVELDRTVPGYGTNPIFNRCFNTTNRTTNGTHTNTVTVNSSGTGWDSGESLSAGTYTLRVTGYDDDGSDCVGGTAFGPLTTTGVTVIPPPTTTTTIVANFNPSAPGQRVMYTAHVTWSGGDVADGDVEFKTGGTSCADAVDIGDDGVDNDGEAFYTLSQTEANNLSSGTIVRACFVPESGFQASEGQLTQYVLSVTKLGTNQNPGNADSDPDFYTLGTSEFLITIASPAGAPTATATIYFEDLVPWQLSNDGNTAPTFEAVTGSWTCPDTDTGVNGPGSQETAAIQCETTTDLAAGESVSIKIKVIPTNTATDVTNRLSVRVGSVPSQPDWDDNCSTLVICENVDILAGPAPSPNTAPDLGAIGNQSVVEGTALAFTATATDDGLPAPPALSFSLQTPGAACLLLHPQVPAGATITGGGAFSWTPTESEGPGIYCARIQVSDGALSDFEDFTINVTEGNAAPVLAAIGNQSVDELVELTFTPSATDSDLPANTLTFSLGTPGVGCGFPIAAGAAVTAGVFSWTPTEAQGPGTYCARVVVSDGTDTDYEDFQIAVAEVNLAPVLTAIGPQSVDELVQLSFAAAATDADLPTNTLTFSLGTPAVACGHPIASGAAISGAGAFTWTPTELQGPGTYCTRVVVSDGTDTDVEDIVITVAEVNVAPVLAVPADFSVAWGVAISGKEASATDTDLPANTLTFSLVGEPAGMTINGTSGLISWTPTGAQVGAHVITVRVTDNGTPVLYDETPTFTITVLPHGTTLTYDGSLSGQYSDQADLSATLTDNVTNTPISGKLVRFTFGGTNVGTFTTNASGVASTLYTVPKPDGSNTVTSNFNGDAQYLGASDSDAFDVDAEDANVTPDITNPNAVQVGSPGGTGTVTLKFDVKEDVTPTPEPDVNDGALAGNINNAGFGVTLISVANGGNVALTCTAPSAAAGYTTRTFTCTKSGVLVGAYEVAAVIGAGGSPTGTYYIGRYDDALTVYDPSLGFVTGGGKFIIDATGDRVSFGLVVNYTGKGKTTARGNLVVVRHHADGSTCRSKSNAIDAPAISGITATFSGKANYGCVDALGNPLPGGGGNLTLTGYVEDNGEPGSSAATTPDKFWVRVMGELLMPTPGATNAKNLTGGNIQVPKVK